MVRVNLIARDNGFGLSRHLSLLQDALDGAGFAVTISGIRRGALCKALRPLALRGGTFARRMSGRGVQRWDVNLMLERIRPEYLPTARRNVLVPHPEWFDARDRAWLPRLDRAFALTHHAVPIFESLGVPVDYTGFTSADRLDATVPRERAFFHLAGRSRNKGTGTLLAVWRRHPEWPRLTVLQDPRSAQAVPVAPNIVHRVDYIADAELQHIQNAHRFHLCPSETEGFGHYLVEAMGVGAVVITIDAPPMNEMVTPARGALIPFARTGAQALATTYFYDESALETVVERLLDTPDGELDRIGTAARAWFEDNDLAFRTRIGEAVRALVEASSPDGAA
ncbi:MAG: glycosyltransferase [Rhodanobacteraceae bacterium]